MNATELTERLIEDLKSSILIRSTTDNILTQVNNLGIESPGNFVGALNVITFDAHLNILAQILSLPSNSAPTALNYLETNKDNVINLIDELLNNSNIILLDNLEPVEIILKDELNELHRYSGSKL